MTVNQELLSMVGLLACPCPQHSPVSLGGNPDGLTCASCGTVFPVRDGIPVMLLAEAVPGPSGIGFGG